MNKLLFLGTGPAGGTKHGQRGKSKRMESSALLTLGNKHILIDVTQFFAEQSKKIKKIDAVLISHGHADAYWGIPDLENWLEKNQPFPIPLFTHPKTIAIIHKKFPKTKYLNFFPVKPYQVFHVHNVQVKPFFVKHSIQKGFPTLGFLFGKELAYASDVAGWSKRAEKCMKQAKTLIIDGAMWKKVMPAHLTLPDVLNKLCTWPNERIIFTQIGNTAPPFGVLKKEIAHVCSKALPAYDGMTISF